MIFLLTLAKEICSMRKKMLGAKAMETISCQELPDALWKTAWTNSYKETSCYDI